MKAKEYLKKYNENPDKEEALAETVISFFTEMEDIAKTRTAKSDQAFISIIKEQGQKWEAFAKNINGVKPDGFIEFCKSKMPFLIDYGL